MNKFTVKNYIEGLLKKALYVTEYLLSVSGKTELYQIKDYDTMLQRLDDLAEKEGMKMDQFRIDGTRLVVILKK